MAFTSVSSVRVSNDTLNSNQNPSEQTIHDLYLLFVRSCVNQILAGRTLTEDDLRNATAFFRINEDEDSIQANRAERELRLQELWANFQARQQGNNINLNHLVSDANLRLQILSEQQINQFIEFAERQESNQHLSEAITYLDLALSVNRQHPVALQMHTRLIQKRETVLRKVKAYIDSYNIGNGISSEMRESFQLCQNLADNGHPIAQWQRGLMFDRGLFLEINHEKAFDYFKNSAQQGFTEAQYEYALKLHVSKWGHHSHGNAWHYALKAAQKEHPEALCMIGDYYFKGHPRENLPNPKPDWKSAYECFEKAANLGSSQAIIKKRQVAEAYYKLAMEHFQKKINGETNPKYGIPEAWGYFLAASEREHIESQYMVGLYYAKGWPRDGGHSNTPDHQKALVYFERAALQSHKTAAEQVVYYYQGNDGIPCNHEKVREFQAIVDR